MTRIDALAEQESNARSALARKLADLADVVTGVQFEQSIGCPLSIHLIVNKAKAVEEADLIWQATRFAVEQRQAHRSRAVG